jgi:DNA repair protein RecN (Recombination protein N)
VAKAASGGELSRVMLALRLVAQQAGVATNVFDEIDAGIGGEAGVSIGRSLAQLGRTRQVLCVTHLPQVAAFADAQVSVRKATAGKRTIADVSLILDDARIEELARMLAGVASDTARDHARELLALAADARVPATSGRRKKRA